MSERIDNEIALLQRSYSELEYASGGQWVRIPAYPLPPGWSRAATDVAFPIPPGYPGTPPYGICVPVGLLFNGGRPNNYTEPASNTPPFGGSWGVLSWTPHDGQWRPSADILPGSNLLDYVRSFADRFREGM